MIDRRAAASGFTLVEVLVALVILAMVSGFAFSTIKDSFGRLSQADMEQEAVSVAETAMDRLGRDLPIRAGHLAGADGRMQWVIDISPALADPPPASGLAAYPVIVQVDWQDAKTRGHFQLQSVLLGLEPGPL